MLKAFNKTIRMRAKQLVVIGSRMVVKPLQRFQILATTANLLNNDDDIQLLCHHRYSINLFIHQITSITAINNYVVVLLL